MESSGRRKKASKKLRVIVDSEDSEDDFDFVPQAKKSKNNVKRRRKSEGVVEKSNTSAESKSKRLSRDEKLFNKDLEKALVKSKDTSLSSAKEDESINTSYSPRASQPVEELTLDDSDYIPGRNNHSDSDADFEPSPKLEKSTEFEGKKAKKVPTRKETVKVAVKSIADIKCDKLLGSLKPSPSVVSTVKVTDLPGSRPPAELQTAVEPTTTPPVRRKGVAKWVPPARIGNSTGQPNGNIPPVRSAGGAPTIRVGLSRRAPIKPLHTQQSPLQTK